MFFRSIRWRLQLWYGLILVVVLVGFGVTAYQLQRGRQLRRTDAELERRLSSLTAGLRLPSFRQRTGVPRPEDLRPDVPPPGNMDRNPLFRDDGPEGGPERGPGPPPGNFHLPPQQAALFDESDANGVYYMIWRRDGQGLARSSNAPPNIPMPAKSKFAEPQPPRTRGNFREVFHSTPPGEILLAGRSIAPELDDLRRTAAWLAISGSVILLLGLGGGWWSATQAIRPIQDISGTALKIAGGDLSQRINVSDTQNELGKLANILNSTFSRLEGSFAEQKQFTSDAAHELRTPVSVMLTQTQTALSRERSLPEYRETLEACQRAAQRMRRLIEALLELARLDAGQESMKRQKFDLSRVAAECVDLIRPLAEQNKLAIECELSAAQCEGDPERLGQVITNLLTNAIHYNHEGGNVSVAIEVQSGSVSFSVTNTGPGISAEDSPRLFSRFYRADKSRTAGRSGLGLAISRAIVEAHSGTIEVASEPGQGATFIVRLPT